MPLKIKVCGMVNPFEINAIDSLVDLIGFVFYTKSPRHNYNPVMNNNASRVGVFVNDSTDYIKEMIHKYKLSYVQLHGDETPETCSILNREVKIIKAFGIDDNFDFSKLKKYELYVQYFLFDTKCDEYGGSGKTHNWNHLEKYQLNTPFFLSGGISPEKLDQINCFSHPKMVGIDLNSGFEIKPGNKNIEQLQSFIHELKK